MTFHFSSENITLKTDLVKTLFLKIGFYTCMCFFAHLFSIDYKGETSQDLYEDLDLLQIFFVCLLINSAILLQNIGLIILTTYKSFDTDGGPSRWVRISASRSS